MRLRDGLHNGLCEGLRYCLALAAMMVLFGTGASAQPVPAAMSASAVQAAAEAVRADPLMPGTEKTKILQFKERTGKAKPEKPGDGRWWLELIDQLSTGMRVGVWLVGTALLIWVLLRLRDWLLAREGARPLAALPPSHVGTLDIRPETLPADIGGAARALWQRGDARAALSLLYRGALSRLVHGHGVPIRAASTESDCLALAAGRLAPASLAFLAQLIGAWQAVAYAGRPLLPADLEQLCGAFDAHLPPTAPGGQA